jgi:hypothetical protein
VTSTHCLCSHRKAAARLANGGGLDFLLIHYERRIATARSHDFAEDFCGCFAADRLSARPCTPPPQAADRLSRTALRHHQRRPLAIKAARTGGVSMERDPRA